MKHTLLFFFSCCCSFCMAQTNLVPNPSFEDTISCFTAGGSVEKAKHWYKAEKTPDYFHECVVTPNHSVPDNQFGFQYAATGMAYCGFATYSTVDTFYREKIGVELLVPLTVGVKYYVSFKINFANRCGCSMGGCNKLGALFSTVKYTNTNAVLISKSNHCQIWTDSVIVDSINWVLVSGSFIADEAYTYMTIGSFFPLASMDTVRTKFRIGGFGLESYYFIDDVCVSEDSVMCADNTTSIVSALQSHNRALAAYPNPANNSLSIETETYTPSFLELYTLSGQILLRQKIPRGHNHYTQDVSQIANGIYFLKLVTNNQILTQKIIIHH